MNSKIKIFGFFLIISVSFLSAQENGKLKITGDSMVGKRMNGRMIRKVIGSVIMTQGDVTVTCDTAIQYLAENNAELIGSVVVIKDTTRVLTDRGFYYGDSKIAFSESGILLTDGYITLTAENGFYYSEDDRAYFFDNVKLADSLKTLFSDRLRYFGETDVSEAAGNVMILQNSSSLFADSLINYKRTRITDAFNNVEIINDNNGVIIFGERLFDDPANKFTKISGAPLLVQKDTSETGRIDTLLISCRMMESISDSQSILIAEDSVKIWRRGFSSINYRSVYFRDKDKIQTLKPEDKPQPILWSEDSQVTGDSIDIYLKDNSVDLINIVGDGFILSEQKNFPFRFNQISGDTIKLFFDNSLLKKTQVFGDVLSIYYLFEDEEPNGLIKSSAEQAEIILDSAKAAEVKFFGSVENEYHPENLIAGKEKDFTLPSFVLYSNRPNKNDLLRSDRLKRHSENIIKKKKRLLK